MTELSFSTTVIEAHLVQAIAATPVEEKAKMATKGKTSEAAESATRAVNEILGSILCDFRKLTPKQVQMFNTYKQQKLITAIDLPKCTINIDQIQEILRRFPLITRFSCASTSNPVVKFLANFTMLTSISIGAGKEPITVAAIATLNKLEHIREINLGNASSEIPNILGQFPVEIVKIGGASIPQDIIDLVLSRHKTLRSLNGHTRESVAARMLAQKEQEQEKAKEKQAKLEALKKEKENAIAAALNKRLDPTAELIGALQNKLQLSEPRDLLLPALQPLYDAKGFLSKLPTAARETLEKCKKFDRLHLGTLQLSDEAFSELVAFFQNVRGFQCGSLSKASLQRMAEGWKELTVLALDDMETAIGNSEMEEIVKLQELTHLRLEKSDFQLDLLYRFAQLNSVDLDENIPVSDIDTVLNRHRTLVRFNHRGFKQSNDSQAFEVFQTAESSSVKFEEYKTSSNSVDKLMIKAANKLTDNFLKELASREPQMKVIELREACNLTDEALKHLANFTRLERVILYGANKITEEAAKACEALLKKVNPDFQLICKK